MYHVFSRMQEIVIVGVLCLGCTRVGLVLLGLKYDCYSFTVKFHYLSLGSLGTET